MDISRISKIYDELSAFGIELEPDPTVLGPQYLGSVIAKCRNYLNRTTSILLEIRRERHMVSNDLSREKAAFKIQSDGLLATDERVRTRPNIRDREAIINVILSDRANKIQELENELRNLDAIEGAVKVRHTELVRTDGQIKTQRSLIRDELDTQSFYGDENQDRRKGTVDEAELDQLMSGGPVEMDLEPLTVKAPESQTPATAPHKQEEPPPAEVALSELSELVESTTLMQAPVAKEEEPALLTEIEAALQVAEEALPEVALSVASKPVSEEAEMESFLKSEAVKEPVAKGRKSAKKDPAPLPIETSAEDDFNDILANL